MAESKDGGPAYPVIQGSHIHGDSIINQGMTGMTIRDVFAAHAMGAQISQKGVQFPTDIARLAYIAADCMLKERKL